MLSSSRLGIAAVFAMSCHGREPSDKHAVPVATRIAVATAVAETNAPTPLVPPEQPTDVLVWIETVPPGATIVRVSDRFILGRTPETIEFHREPQPIAIRLEMPGFIPETRDVSVAQDGSLAVTLKADPRKQLPGAASSKSRK